MADGGDSRRERPSARFHGRVGPGDEPCAEPGCAEPGEFRAPGRDGARVRGDGPPRFRWLCLDHVRAFNTRYNYFAGMSVDEIHDAQHPLSGWERETRAFASNAGDRPPRWADFSDPLDAIQGRFGRAKPAGRTDGKPVGAGERKALEVLGLGIDADRAAIRKRYSELVRRYHPDRNGGDRSHEQRLQQVVEAYQRLRASATFA
ncbi:MAG: J domain-containing protein [Pseudomonadota bacterium]